MEKGWGELSDPNALEEAKYYLECKKMKMAVMKATNENYVPEMSNEPALLQEVLLEQAPVHVPDPVMDLAL